MKLGLKKPQIILVLGGPGSGKGTQCLNIAQHFKWTHLSAGELLRQELQKQTKNSKLIEQIILDGKIVPSEITVDLLKQRIFGGDEKKYLVDGFPRNQENLEQWIQQTQNLIDFQFMLYIQCPKEILLQRILKRANEINRSDDNIQSFEKRMETFENETLKIIQYFNSIQKLKTVDGNGDVETVFDHIKKYF